MSTPRQSRLTLVESAGTTAQAKTAWPQSDVPTVLHVIHPGRHAVRMAPLVSALARTRAFHQVLVDTGRRVTEHATGELPLELGLPAIDHFLDVPAGSPSAQAAAALASFEAAIVEKRPTLVVVCGDGAPALGCALAAAHLGVPVAQVDAGIRSGDWSAAEEVNRVCIDRLADTLLTSSPDARGNLLEEAIPAERVHLVGNTIVDALRRCEPRARARAAWLDAGVVEGKYVFVTLQREENVADVQRLAAIADSVVAVAAHSQVVIAADHAVRERLRALGRWDALAQAGVARVRVADYLEAISFECGAATIVTDVSAVQEEAAALGIACYTFGALAERPITLTHGTSILLGDDPAAIAGVRPSRRPPTSCAIPLWDGHAGTRAASVVVANYALTTSAAFL